MDLRAGDIDELYPLELSLPRVAKYSFSPDGPEDIRKVKKHPLIYCQQGAVKDKAWLMYVIGNIIIRLRVEIKPYAVYPQQ